MTTWPSATTQLVALLGWPVRHSLSPAMHNAAFREQELDLVYVALSTPPEALSSVVGALGDVGAVGANVTVPHKSAVARLCTRLTEEAALTGAVNTLVWGADGLVGDNTDAAGFEQALRDDLGLPAGTAAVVLGTGGAARACAAALGRLAARVTFVGRRADAAEELADLAARCGAAEAQGMALDEGAWLVQAVEEAGLVVNATPLGMAGEPLPEPFQQLRPGQVAYDLVYHPAETPFLAAARRRGADAHNGLGMLVAQGAASYRRWTGRDAPVATMSAAALAALTAAPRPAPQ